MTLQAPSLRLSDTAWSMPAPSLLLLPDGARQVSVVTTCAITVAASPDASTVTLVTATRVSMLSMAWPSWAARRAVPRATEYSSDARRDPDASHGARTAAGSEAVTAALRAWR